MNPAAEPHTGTAAYRHSRVDFTVRDRTDTDQGRRPL
jgi:hypothetical protein